MEEDLLSSTPTPAAPTDSFSHNWVLNTCAAAPFEFCYISSRSDSNAAIDDDQASASAGSSFNFGTHLPHWYAGKVHDGDVIYADELFLNGFMKATTDFTPPPLQEKETESSMCCAVAKHPEASPSPAAAVLLGCKVLVEKWGRHTVMKLWKVLKQLLITMDKKAVEAGTSKSSRGGVSCLEPEEGIKREIDGTSSSSSSSFYDNPIYEAVLHCKRSNGGYNNQ